MHSPLFFSQQKGAAQCSLCPRRCLLEPGKAGQCRIRFNRSGGEIPFYGFVTALALDPIEKKPLYHFRPGTEIFSVGFAGCNLRCPFCQNWHISQRTDIPGKFYSPTELIQAAREAANAASNAAAFAAPVSAIAYTYSEPLVHIEYLLDCMNEARRQGLANVLVSNGCINSEAAAEVLNLCDAANIDLKCFSKETYAKTLGGDLDAVTGFIRMAAEKQVHLEITTLLVPGLNDSGPELDKCRDFIVELQAGNKPVPWHLSAYHPDYNWREAATSTASIMAAIKRAEEKLCFVYAGNITGASDTICPFCGNTLVSRRGYKVDCAGLALKEKDGKQVYFCSSCNKSTPICP